MDCYLCGASNPADADFCGRCEGQLLSIGAIDDPEIEAEIVEEEFEPEPVQTNAGRRARRSIRSIEHSRLQAALGLGRDDDDDFDDDLLETVVPTAGPTSNIPMIGTKTVTVAAKTKDRSGRLAYGILGALVLAIVWLAYLTLFEEKAPAGPDNLAFTESTLPRDTTTTTEPKLRPWTDSEVFGKFGSVFVTVRLSDCPTASESTSGNEALDERVVPGVAIDDFNVLLPGTEFGSADVGVIVTRFGFTGPARLTPLANGSVVATTYKRMTRNMALSPNPVGEATYFVSHDEEQRASLVSESPSTARVELTVTDQGDAIEVRTDGTTGRHDILSEISLFRTEISNAAGFAGSLTTCDLTPFMVDPSLTATEESEADAP